MNLFSFHKDNLDEVVFENRNKEYGAYAMRKSYDSNLLKASASSFGFLIVCVGMGYLASLIPAPPALPIPDKVPDTEFTDLFRKIEVIIDPPAQAAAAPRNVNPLVFRIEPDHRVPPTTQTPQDPNQASQPLGTENGTPGGAPVGTANGPIVETPPVESVAPATEFATFVEEMPSFVGGQEEMVRYLNKNLTYPAIARENGIEGKVIVAFVVKTDGSVEVLQLLKGIGFGCDDEAIRVIEAMPKWNVGMQNGKKTAVRLQLPIYFKLH